ncbi:hypothetical protein H6F95_05815 [Cyanobacteria bacterium FACHB-471]|nr:hypothetical protein [Cyanobacteria bacterium FACHB-471]
MYMPANIPHAIQRLVLYHVGAAALVFGLYAVGILSLFTALSFAIVLVKIAGILWQQHWYHTTQIQYVALIETLSAILFCLVTGLKVAKLHPNATRCMKPLPGRDSSFF